MATEDLQWTKDTPNETGYYRVRAEGVEPETILYEVLSEFHHVCSFQDERLSHAFRMNQLEWYGPVDKPEEAPHVS